MPLVNYRFYILNRHDHITRLHVAECDGAESIEHTAHELLDREVAGAAVEVWERDHRVCRVERAKAAS